VFAAADLIVKVKEPIPEEYDRFRAGQQLFTYLHLAADRQLTEFLLDRRIDSIARTSTLALTSATLPYLVRVATHGVAGAAARDPVLAKGLTTLGGKLVSRPVAEAHGLPYQDPTTMLPAGADAEPA
jgi:alanine dehydrogenase